MGDDPVAGGEMIGGVFATARRVRIMSTTWHKVFDSNCFGCRHGCFSAPGTQLLFEANDDANTFLV